MHEVVTAMKGIRNVLIVVIGVWCRATMVDEGRGGDRFTLLTGCFGNSRASRTFTRANVTFVSSTIGYDDDI